MGTVVSLAVPAAPGTAPQAAVEELEAATAVVEQLFNGLDRTFSLYRPDSEASAMARGEVALTDASADMRRLYIEASGMAHSHGRCVHRGTARRRRGLGGDRQGPCHTGSRNVVATRAGPEGLVPQRGAGMCAGGRFADTGQARPWLAGIIDPEDRTTLLTAFPLGNKGKASAGDLRNQRTWPPHLVGRPARQAGRGVPAGFSGSGRHHHRRCPWPPPSWPAAGTLALATSHWDVDVLAVKNDGGLLATPGFRTPTAQNS